MQNQSVSPGRPPTIDTSGAARPVSASSHASSNIGDSSDVSRHIVRIEASITKLLAATKNLLECLAKWSQRDVPDSAVSDVYVQLGYLFNVVCRDFNNQGIQTTDLGNVPEELRRVLEQTLTKEASPDSLKDDLPTIRDIIISLLHGLKKKQAILREMHPGTSSSTVSSDQGTAQSSRHGSSRNLQQTLTYPQTRTRSDQRFSDTSNSQEPARSSHPSPNYPSITFDNDPPVPKPYSAPPPNHEPAVSTPKTRSSLPYPTNDTMPVASPSPDVSTTANSLKAGVCMRRASRRLSRAPNQYSMPYQSTPAPDRTPVGARSTQSVRESTLDATTWHRQMSARKLEGINDGESPTRIKSARRSGMLLEAPAGVHSPTPPTVTIEEASPVNEVGDPSQNGTGELTIFLKYKRRIKKLVLPGGREDLSLSRLELAFMEKFAWASQGGNKFPDICVEENGIAYELEDMKDVKNNSIITLNIDGWEEVQSSFTEGISSLHKAVEGIKETLGSQQDALKRVTEAQNAMTREIATLTSAPRQTPISSPNPDGRTISNANELSAPGTSVSIPGKTVASCLKEVQDIKRDVMVLQQTHNTAMSEIDAAMNTVREKASAVKDQSVIGMGSGLFEGKGVKDFSDFMQNCENFVTEVDQLQDTIDDLCQDVAHRGVRPRPSDLEGTERTVLQARNRIRAVEKDLGDKKPLWTKVWMQAIETVREERYQLTFLEEIVGDLHADIQQVEETFTRIKEVVDHYSAATPRQAPAAWTVRSLKSVNDDMDPDKPKERVLDQVRALIPNHESRQKAIEEAERKRQERLKQDNSPFKKELASNVESMKDSITENITALENSYVEKRNKHLRQLWAQEEEDEDDSDEDDEDEDSDDGSGSVTGDEGGDTSTPVKNGTVEPEPTITNGISQPNSEGSNKPNDPEPEVIEDENAVDSKIIDEDDTGKNGGVGDDKLNPASEDEKLVTKKDSLGNAEPAGPNPQPVGVEVGPA